MMRVNAGLLVLVGLLVAIGASAAPTTVGDSRGRGSACMDGQCHRSFRSIERAHAPVAMEICKVCHRPAPGEEHAFVLARDGASLCASCHREKATHGTVHGDLVPEGCTLCHDPHGTGNRFMLPEAEIADVCRSCHAEAISLDNVHALVLADPCTACHDPHVRAEDASARTGAGMCFPCHEQTHAEIDSAPLVHGADGTDRCMSCHDPHGSSYVANLRQDVPALCFGCHEEIRDAVESATTTHTVAAVSGGCLACHDPHVSAVGAGLRADPLTLCRGCHSNEITAAGGRTIAAVSREVETSRFLHGPIRQNDCGACHDVHGSTEASLLVDSYAATFYAPFDLENYRLCFSCHPERKVLTERTTALTGFRNGEDNLHYLHVNKDKQGRTCRACHATHASSAPRHIRSSVTYGEWKLPVGFTMTETGGRCESGCHIPRAYDRQTPVDYGAGASKEAGENER